MALPRRRPPLREVGHDPDYRFSLATERTFLAWIRTALALIAGGVAFPGERTALAWQRTGWTALGAGALVLHAAPSWPGVVAGVVLLVSGVLCSAVVAPLRMRMLEAAAATGRAATMPAVVLTAVVVLVGVLAVTTMLPSGS